MAGPGTGARAPRPYSSGGLKPGPMPPPPSGYQHITIKSTADGTDQDSVLVVPSHVSEPKTLVVYLHGWSVTDTDRRPDAEEEAEKRGWYLLIPNIRGPYDHADGCGSQTVQQDILDGVDFMKTKHSVDSKHIYLLGFSGGGFVSMLTSALHPDTFAAVSEWSGIADLATWYTQEHATDRYAKGMDKCFGGAPTGSPQLADAYKERSPITHLNPKLGVPLDLNGQKEDPIVADTNSLRAFRALAPNVLSDEDMAHVVKGATSSPTPYTWIDPATQRTIYLRREADNFRITIREGGHEMFARAAFEWFDQFSHR